MDTERVTLRHPDTGGIFHCPASAADAWRKNGWEDFVPEPKRPKTTASVAEPAPVKAASAAPRKEK